MPAWRRTLVTSFLLIALVGCTALPFQQKGSPPPGTDIPGGAAAPTNAPTLIPEQTIQSTQPTETSYPAAGGTLLRIWLSPEFDPEGTSAAKKLLQARLQQFVSENPEVRLEVRVKTMEGAGGLLAALAAASAAAPLTLPDLILLPRPLLESAALKGLLYPFDGLTSLMDDPSWFEYARQLSRLKGSVYGLPFAGDAMVLAYRPSVLDPAPDSLEAALSQGKVMLFPATDAQALFTLCLYMAGGGNLQDAEGRPSLDKENLVSILEYDQLLSVAGVMPYWLTQYSNDEQVWEAFRGDEYPMVVTWASSYLYHKQLAPSDLAIAPLPTPGGKSFTFATGWSWALAGQDPDRRQLSVRLVEFLVENDFLAQWSAAAGYLPARSDALHNWQDAELSKVIERISLSAHLLPPADLISTLGPALEGAVVDVLKAQSEPETAAQAVIQQLNPP